VAGFREFNWAAAIALITVVGGGLASADDIRKWTDAEGNVHYSVTGKENSGRPSDSVSVLRGRSPSDEENFSVRASLRRREIEKKLKVLGAALDHVHEEQAKAGAGRFSAWVPTADQNPEAARVSRDAQRDAFLASSQFEQEKAEELRRLRRQERQTLKDLAASWKDFAALESEIRSRYGEPPIWFLPRLACGTCPSAAQVEAALHPRRAEPVAESTPTGSAPASEEDADWGEEDEDWQ
jgi:hypothetical protein